MIFHLHYRQNRRLIRWAKVPINKFSVVEALSLQLLSLFLIAWETPYGKKAKTETRMFSPTYQFEFIVKNWRISSVKSPKPGRRPTRTDLQMNTNFLHRGKSQGRKWEKKVLIFYRDNQTVFCPKLLLNYIRHGPMQFLNQLPLNYYGFVSCVRIICRSNLTSLTKSEFVQ